MIVTGSVQGSGERLRVTTQLVDAASGRYCWSESIDGQASATSSICTEQVAETVIDRLRPELLEAAAAPAATRRSTENLAAHNLYLQGRYHLNQRTEEGLQKAVDFFERAIVEDAHSTPWPTAASPTPTASWRTTACGGRRTYGTRPPPARPRP